MDTQPVETVTITKKEYENLLDRDERLSALEAAGVDNWQGYDDAMDIWRGWKKENMTKYLIWSNEHGAWWGPKESGYYSDVRSAGRYTQEQAEQICANAHTPVKNEPPPEVMVAEEDLLFNARDVSEKVLEEIEFEVGMGNNAWDTIDPKEIIAAAWNRRPPEKTRNYLR